MKNLIFILFFLSLIFQSCSPSASPEPSQTTQKIEETEIIEIQETSTPSPILDEHIETTEEEIIEENNDNINASKIEIECFNIINNKRQENGLEELEWDDELYEVAKIRAEEASRKWSHTRPDGTPWYTVSDEIHGENLAKGYNDAGLVVNAWMDSQGHKENMLRPAFTKTAIFYYKAENGWFWCQTFGY